MSDILFARPSVLDGMGSVIDLFGVLQIYNTSETPDEADRLALISDWAAIGKDFKDVLSRYKA